MERVLFPRGTYKNPGVETKQAWGKTASQKTEVVQHKEALSQSTAWGITKGTCKFEKKQKGKTESWICIEH